MVDTKTLIKQLMECRGYSKYRIAKECKVTWATVQHWAIGRFEASHVNKLLLQRILDQDI